MARKTRIGVARRQLGDACLDGDIATLQGSDLDVNTPVLAGLRPIHVAATAGQPHAIKVLVRLGADLQSVDNPQNKNTALHFAVLAGKVRTVRALLAAGAEVDPQNCVGTTPLHDAARVGDREIIEHLWRYGADWTRANSYGNTILHRAVLYGHVALAQWIVRNTPAQMRRQFIAARNSGGYTARDIAVSRGMSAMVAALEMTGIPPVQTDATLRRFPYSEVDAWHAYQAAIS